MPKANLNEQEPYLIEMKYIRFLFGALILLLGVIAGAAIAPVVEGATGIPHPEFEGMFIGPANIDQQASTRWLGYFFGLGIIAVFTAMLFIGNRKNGQVRSIGRWLILGTSIYALAYTFMVYSHWGYAQSTTDDFFLSMPAPTAWMIYAVWFLPLIITIGYILRFEDSVISDQEIEAFNDFIDQQPSE